MKLMLGIYPRYHKWTWLYENLRSVIEDDTDLSRGGLANRIPPEEESFPEEEFFTLVIVNFVVALEKPELYDKHLMSYTSYICISHWLQVNNDSWFGVLHRVMDARSNLP